MSINEDNELSLDDQDFSSFFNEDFALLSSKAEAYESILKILTTQMKFQDYVRELLKIVVNAVKSEAGSILEVNYVEQNIFFRSAVGRASDQVMGFTIPLGQGIVGHVVESKQVHVMQGEDDKIHLKAIADATGFDVRNLIAIPLMIRGNVYGVLELLNRVGEEEYTQNDIEMLEAICEAVTKAIELRLLLMKSKSKASEAA